MIDPTSGPRPTGQSAQIHLNSPVNLKLPRRGTSLHIFVEEVGDGASVVLRVGGDRFRAISPFPMRKGEWYVARAQEINGRVSLRLQSQTPRLVTAEEIARSVRMPNDMISQAVVRAFLRSGLPLLPDRLHLAYRKVVTASKRQERNAKEIARFAALAEKKGLLFDGDNLDMSVTLGSHGRPYSRDNLGSQGRKRETNNGSDRLDEPDESDVRTSFRLSADGDHPIQLFNHIVGEGDHWVVIPINAPGKDLDASLRIRIPRGYALGIDRSLPGVREAVLVVTSKGERWLFGLQPSRSGIRVALLSHTEVSSVDSEGGAHADQLRPLSEGLRELAKRLESIGVPFVRNTLPAELDDGFSQADSLDIITSVDSSA